MGKKNSWERKSPQTTTPPAPPKECQYCQDPARFSLGPAVPEIKEEKTIFWHHELYQDVARIPKRRILCQLSA